MDPFLSLYTKINSKWIKELKGRPKIVKFLEEKTYVKSSITVILAMIAQILTLKVQALKAKIDNGDYINLKSFCAVKETINRVKSNLWNGRKHMQIMHLIRGYYPKYIRNSYNSIAKKQTKNNKPQITKF